MQEAAALAVEEICRFEAWFCVKVDNQRLTNAERLILKDYLYYKMSEAKEKEEETPPSTLPTGVAPG